MLAGCHYMITNIVHLNISHFILSSVLNRRIFFDWKDIINWMCDQSKQQSLSYLYFLQNSWHYLWWGLLTESNQPSLCAKLLMTADTWDFSIYPFYLRDIYEILSRLSLDCILPRNVFGSRSYQICCLMFWVGQIKLLMVCYSIKLCHQVRKTQ